MRFDTYMDACLYDPDGGYFSAGRVRPGTGSDFVTSPEVSPAFGALIAGWAAESDPSGNAALIEIGAGSGALLREIAPAWLDNSRKFRRHDEEALRELAAKRHDREAYISSARQHIRFFHDPSHSGEMICM